MCGCDQGVCDNELLLQVSLHDAMNLHEAKRPVLILGAGVRQAGAENEARELIDLLQIPVCLTWGAADIMPEGPLRIGTFGTHGTRAANFAVQNADFILSIGCRLDTKATGTPAEWFAREAHIVMVDIDQSEINKMAKVGVSVDGVCEDAKRYVTCLIETHSSPYAYLPAYTDWLARCQDWKRRYPPVLPEYEKESGVNPYVLIRELSRLCEPGDIIVCDTGCTVAWICQAWEFKEGQRLLHPWNQTPMGYAISGAIGAHYATGKRIICITGDGALMMGIGELATIAGKMLPVHVLLLNNGAHAMCRATEREWMDAKHCATGGDCGLSFPAFFHLTSAFGWRPRTVQMAHEVGVGVSWLLEDDRVYPRVLIAEIDQDHDVKPKTKFGKPNEDGYPYLPREEFRANMIVEQVS